MNVLCFSIVLYVSKGINVKSLDDDCKLALRHWNSLIRERRCPCYHVNVRIWNLNGVGESILKIMALDLHSVNKCIKYILQQKTCGIVDILEDYVIVPNI